MSGLKRRLPTPAMLVAVAALVVSLGGVAVAGGVFSKRETRVIKRIAAKKVRGSVKPFNTVVPYDSAKRVFLAGGIDMRLSCHGKQPDIDVYNRKGNAAYRYDVATGIPGLEPDSPNANRYGGSSGGLGTGEHIDIDGNDSEFQGDGHAHFLRRGGKSVTVIYAWREFAGACQISGAALTG